MWPDGLTAINSKLGWVLNGPYENKVLNRQDKNKEASTVNVTPTNLIKVTDDIDLEVDDVTLNKQVETLWNLESLGIMDNEST